MATPNKPKVPGGATNQPDNTILGIDPNKPIDFGNPALNAVGNFDVGGAVTGTINNTVNATQAVGNFLGKLSNPNLWRRIGIVTMGGLFIWWGIVIFLSNNKKIQGAVVDGAKKIASATPEGAAANLATGTLT